MKETNTPCVFLSWSGGQSRKIADAFSDLFKSVFAPTIKSFMSSRDIGAGDRSIGTLFKMLEKCNYGVCFINAENARAPWIQFEAGALSKIVDDSQVMVLLLDQNSINSLYGTPLAEFQHKLFTKDDVKSIFNEIIKKYGLNDDKDSFLKRFDGDWDDFYNKAEEALKEKIVIENVTENVQFAEKGDLDTIKKMLLNVQNLLKTEYSQTIKDSISLLDELKKIVKSMSPEDLKDMKMQFKVQRYELVFQQNIRDIEDIIDDLESEEYAIDVVREKLNNIIGRTMSLIND